MSRSTRWLAGLGAVALVGSLVALAPRGAERTDNNAVAAHGVWKIQATGARIIGGYGNNFAYNGENVRALKGSATMTVDRERGTARLEIDLETTPASGAIRFSAEKSWTGKIQIVQNIDTGKMKKARIAQEIFLHGDTGNEAPVMPTIYNYFATWGPSSIRVNGEEVIAMIGSHTMFSERARGPDGKIARASGEVYSPMSQDKSGFTDGARTEFHFVAHTTKPDAKNFPPHSGWIHLHFSDVTVLEQPSGVKIPYTAAD